MVAQTSYPTAPATMSGGTFVPQTFSERMRIDALAVDFETTYSATYSVKDMGTYAFVHDPRFKATEIAAHCDKWGCSTTPDRFDWTALHGVSVIAHNAAFDKAVFDRLQEQGIIPATVKPAAWFCSSNLSRYLNGPSSLKDCASAWLGIDLDKSVRDRMKSGMRDLFDDVAAYAMEDARVCWELWKKLSKLWPAHERRLADLTRRMGAYGLHLDTAYVNECRERLSGMVADGIASLPWVSEFGQPALSIDAFKAYCTKSGVTPPSKTAKTDADLDKWRTSNAGSKAVAWLDAMQGVRRSNRSLKVFDAMLARVMPHNSRMTYELRYCGASTGRWSGAGGLNLQNQNRDEIAEGIDIRNAITAAPGHKLVIIDYAQIESRVLLWLAGDQQTLDILRTGIDLYEAHARATMGYRDPRPLKDVDKAMRQLAKARVLGLGYGCGAKKFIIVAKIMGGLDITFDDSTRIVNDYRRANPLITSLWDRLEQAFCTRHGKTYALPLPSGRRLYYHNVDADLMTAESVKGNREDFYGGKLAENFVSATARDILADAWIKLEDAGLRVVLTVHDEVVLEVPEAEAASALEQATTIMQTPPAWAEGLPLAVEGKVCGRYEK